MSKCARRLWGPLFASALAGCVSYVRPGVEPWVEPVDLGLAPTDLAGVKVGVQCGRGERDEAKWTKQLTDGCTGVVKLIAGLGARVMVDEDLLDREAVKGQLGVEASGGDAGLPKGPDPNSTKGKVPPSARPIEKPDFTLVYIDRDTDFDLDGWSILYYYFTGWLGDKDSRAELQILDARELVVERKQLAVTVRTYYGLPALYLLLVDLGRGGERHEYRRQLAGNLATYIRNTVQTYNVRRMIAARAARAER